MDMPLACSIEYVPVKRVSGVCGWQSAFGFSRIQSGISGRRYRRPWKVVKSYLLDVEVHVDEFEIGIPQKGEQSPALTIIRSGRFGHGRKGWQIRKDLPR